MKKGGDSLETKNSSVTQEEMYKKKSQNDVQLEPRIFSEKPASVSDKLDNIISLLELMAIRQRPSE